MPVSTQRVLDAIEQMTLAVADSAPHLAPSLQILVGELRRRDRQDLLDAHYRSGRALLLKGLDAGWATTPEARSLARDIAALPGQLDAAADWRAAQRRMTALMALASRFAALGDYPGGDAEFEAAVSALHDWEASESVPPGSETPSVEGSSESLNAEVLQAILRRDGGAWRDARVSNLRPLGGGVSKLMLKLDVETAAGVAPVIARIDTDVPVLESVYRGMKVSHEYHLLRYVFRLGKAPVAEPLLYADAANPLERELFISSCLPGETKMDLRLSKQVVSPALMGAIAAMFAQVHRTPLDPADPDLARTHFAQDIPANRIEAYRRFIQAFEADWRRRGEPASPVIETCLRWLLDNIPNDPRPASLVHGDCGLNNQMTDGDRVTGLIDWECAHYGDPAEDLSSFLFVSQGAVDPEAFIDAYVAAGGERPSEFAMLYHGVIARLKLLIARDVIRALYETEARAKPELAVAAFVFGERTIADLSDALRRADAARP